MTVSLLSIAVARSLGCKADELLTCLRGNQWLGACVVCPVEELAQAPAPSSPGPDLAGGGPGTQLTWGH